MIAVVADGSISFFGLTRTTSNWGAVIYDGFVYAGISNSQGSLCCLLPSVSRCSPWDSTWYRAGCI